MKDVLKDEKFRKLLRDKQKYEIFSWIIPIVSILSLIIILFLTSKNDLTEFTIVVLILLILLIVLGYIFDNKLTMRIHASYARLNQYFQDIIVPQLLVKDNETIVFHDDCAVTAEIIDRVEVFDHYQDFTARYNYTGKLSGYDYSFSEVLFDNPVHYDTNGTKIVNNEINNEINYHWYIVNLHNSYPTEALYLVGKFANFDKRNLKKYQTFDFTRFRLHQDNPINLYIADITKHEEFTGKEIVKVLNSQQLENINLAIYIRDNELHIIIEELDNLINLTHSNKIVVENLLKDYYAEQALIRKITQSFEKDVK